MGPNSYCNLEPGNCSAHTARKSMGKRSVTGGKGPLSPLRLGTVITTR